MASYFFDSSALVKRYHPRQHRLRTLDSLQLAVALDLHGQKVIEQFVAADQVLCDVAAREGLPVVNPERS